MRRTPLVAAIALSLSLPALAQDMPGDSFEATRDGTRGTTSIPVTYAGPNTRLSLGIDDDANVMGEILAVFGKQDDSAWLFEGWLGHGGEGGVKLDYHWVWGRGGADSSRATVAKVFGAVDQNQWDDRKATLGVGFERNDVFLDVYASGALTDERLVGTDVDSTVTTITGTDAGRPFQQTQTVTVTTRSFEHPYDWGIGARLGRHFDGPLLRLRGGLDFEKGDFDSDQLTFSLGLDKYIRNTGHAITLELEHYERNGEGSLARPLDESDTRAWLIWRYDFGNTFRPAPGAYREVERPREVTVEVPGEPVLVKNDVRMDVENFFEFDRAELKPGAQAALDELVAVIKSEARVSRVAVVGSTCDLGPTAYNQSLSERRANAVRAFLESRGVATTELDVKGVGETQPKYPNDSEENRRRNRRVDVSFLTVETVEKPGEPRTETRTEMEWVREEVEAPPAFIERALRNPAEHKRTVDVYSYDEVDSETTLGPRTFLNRPPQAVDDAAGATCASPIVVPVLANDSDPDGDPIRVTAITVDSASAQATINANGTVTFQILRTPGTAALCNDGGTLAFGYTIADSSGATSSANVRINVAAEPFDAVDDSATTPQATPVVINVVGNDTLLAGSVVTNVGTPANGTAVSDANGRVTYTPRADFVGVDTFTYTVTSPQGRTDTATVRVTVTAGPSTSNRPPVANDDFLNTLSNVDTNINVLRNDSDPDGDPIRITSYTQPANGFVTETQTPGVFVYRSNSGFCGEDTFTYTITDSAGNTDTATVTINVLD